MWEKILIGLALFLVAEGVMPFLNPTGFRRYLLTVAQQPERVLRFVGLASMVLGVMLLLVVSR